MMSCAKGGDSGLDSLESLGSPSTVSTSCVSESLSPPRLRRRTGAGGERGVEDQNEEARENAVVAFVAERVNRRKGRVTLGARRATAERKSVVQDGQRGGGGGRRGRSSKDGQEVLLELHQTAFWTQWQLALLQVSSDIMLASSSGAGVKAQTQAGEGEHQLTLSPNCCERRVKAFREEVAHLQLELGRVSSAKARLERDAAQDVGVATALESQRAALQAQLVSVEAAKKKLESDLYEARVEREEGRERQLQAEEAVVSLRQDKAQAGERVAAMAAEKATLEERAAELERAVLQRGNELHRTQETLDLVQASTAETSRQLEESNSALKTKLAEAGSKIEALRQERNSISKDRSELEARLSDVENFFTSDKGKLLSQLEQDLAAARLALAEMEAEKDELEVQLGLAS